MFDNHLHVYKEVFVKHEQAPTAPKLEGVCFLFVDFKNMYIFYENRYFLANWTASVQAQVLKTCYFWLFWPILQLPVGCFDRNGQKAHLLIKTSYLSLKPSHHDLPFKSSSPYKKAMTDGRTDGHPNSIGPQLLGWGLIKSMNAEY